MNKKTLDPTSSPWAPFGVQLRRSREGRGLTQAQLARKCKYDPSYVSFVELAQRPPSEQFAARADAVLETGGTLSLMYWQHRHTALVPGFPEYANYESRAEEIRLFEINVIPGLLQTKAYATAWEHGNVRRGTATQEHVEERVNFLLTRQQCLQRTPPPLVHAVLDESCLRRPIGGRDVMVEQLLHLEHMAEQPNILLQVAPYSLGEDRPFTRVVTMLTMPGRKMLAYTETEQRGYLDRDTESVAALAKDYNRLLIEAMNQAESVAMIRAVRRDFEWTSI
ncbi:MULTISPECIES: Scr1 family TA system antitoxin-like transcriptional regulator [unclassified Kitasatospora]|uniref:helix-turn-helix domain-containing protein n=1 Tax=unclassified Kitasatospora TaxID=2633591 RepID=UPI00381640E7